MNIFIFFAIIILSSATGCSVNKSLPHAWQTQGNNVELTISCRNFQTLNNDDIFILPETERKEYAQLLQQQEFLMLSKAQIEQLKCPFKVGQAFLVRAISYGEHANWKVFFDPVSRICYTYSASWSGENLTTLFASDEITSSPLVVRLAEAPSRVYSAAQTGGDGVGMHP